MKISEQKYLKALETIRIYKEELEQRINELKKIEISEIESNIPKRGDYIEITAVPFEGSSKYITKGSVHRVCASGFDGFKERVNLSLSKQRYIKCRKGGYQYRILTPEEIKTHLTNKNCR